VIALTGGIGSGKSAALAAFGRCGAATLSADEAAHDLYADAEVATAVVERFGAEVLGPDGGVDRAALARRAFADPAGIGFLEELLHPRIGRRRAEWVAAQRAATPPPLLCVCEVPLLYEARAEDGFDAVLVVTAPDSVRRERVEARGHDFAARSARQLPEADKVARADAAFVNDGSLAALEAWVAARFREHAGRPCRG
jgi:dephospho-CoA kinase